MTYVLSDYVNFKKLVCNKEYAKEKNLKVSFRQNLYVVKYDKSKLNQENQHTLGLFRSVIVDSDGNVLCIAPPKSIDFDCFSQTTLYEQCDLQEFIEGTMINVFWDKEQGEWEIATRSNIGARCRYNLDNEKTFRYMFLDAMNHSNIDFNMLDNKYCYSFTMQHPDNRIVIPITDKKLYLTNIYECVNDDTSNIVNIIDLKNIVLDAGIDTPKKIDLVSDINYKGNSWKDLTKHFSSDNLDYTIQGVVCYDNKTKTRTKLRSKNYEKVKHLKGNSTKMQYHYYYLRQRQQVGEFLKYYPEYNKLFNDLRSNLHDWTNQLYQNYIGCFIRKEQSLRDYPYNFKTHMFKLHEIYMNDLKPVNKYINKLEVMTYANNLPPPRLMYSVNHQMKQFSLDTKRANLVN